MAPISVFTAAAIHALDGGNIIHSQSFGCCALQIVSTAASVYITASWHSGGRMAFMPVFAPDDVLQLSRKKISEDEIQLSLKGVTGQYKVVISLHEEESLFRYTTTFIPAFNALMPFSPRDILPYPKQGDVQNTAGSIHMHQVGTRSGILFFSMVRPVTGSVFYMQNLTALNAYCEDTETSAGDLVGGSWPEIGFRLPPTEKGKPLQAGKSYCISDAFVVVDDRIFKTDVEITQGYLNNLAKVYLKLPKPGTQYHNWPSILQKGLHGIQHHKGCWKFADGRAYLNAYVSDYDTPPEVMVQLAVLLPLVDFDRWSGENHEGLIITLKDGISNFYDPRRKTILRWLPAWENRLDNSEEQKKAGVMDSWYLHHPLMNLSRLALEGDKEAGELLMDSVGYVIKVARHFKYNWPVFYNMDTLEVIKAETAPGKGGEKDVPGAYAHLMIQVWQLTGENKYLEEAKRAAKKLKGLGFDIFYQANNTAFSAGALLRLYKETEDEVYLNLSYACIAAIFKNVQLWEGRYGNLKNFPTFFAVYPLNDAPYTAPYEEQEVFAGMHNYLREAEGVAILPSVKLLLAEFIKYAAGRLAYYYPPMLPKEMISEDVKTGETDAGLWVALEDLNDGWEKSGKVGQEVYGAGVAFGIVPRQYFKVPGYNILVYVDYPVAGYKASRNSVTFRTKGSGALGCRLAIISTDDKKLPEIAVTTGEGASTQKVMPVKRQSLYTEYSITGDAFITVILT